MDPQAIRMKDDDMDGDMDDGKDDDRTMDDTVRNGLSGVLLGLGRLAGRVKTAWSDYTSDVRNEDPEVTETTSEDAYRVEPASAPSTLSSTVPSDGGVMPTGHGPILRAFLDGLHGARYDGPGILNRIDHSSNDKIRTRSGLKIVIGVFAAIGVLAVVRAAIDAFRPGR